jgi:hypothetical protein
MRRFGGVAVVLAASVFVGAAAAGPIPVPPVPTVPTVTTVPTAPVSVPPAPTPLPAIPTLPKPVVPVAPSTTSTVAHTAATVAPATAGVASTVNSGGSSGSSAGSSGGSSGASPGFYGGASSSGSPATSSADPRVKHFQSSRGWIGTTGPKHRRTTTLTFVVPHATRVVFIVNQLAPACVGIGRFSVAAHAGVNHVRFAGRLHGRQLAPGTYRISVRTPSGHVIRRITLVVVGGSAPSRGELRALRAANACHGGNAPTSSAYSTGTGGGTSAMPTDGATAGMPAQPLPRPATKPAGAGIGVPTPDINSGVLASSVEKTAQAIRPLLVALLALSILLLGVASLPRVAVPEPRVHDLLARHRVEIAGLGAAALVAVAIAFLV